MQASKILPRTIYAIKSRLNENTFVRFEVTKVITIRSGKSNSPHDYHSVVEGVVLPQDWPEAPGVEERTLRLDPSAVLGPYEEQITLKNRKEAEDQARAEVAEKLMNAREKLANYLLLLIDREPTPPPKDPRASRYYRDNDPVHPGYNGIEINDEGIRLLSEHFEI